MAKKGKTKKNSSSGNKWIITLLVLMVVGLTAGLINQAHPEWFDYKSAQHSTVEMPAPDSNTKPKVERKKKSATATPEKKKPAQNPSATNEQKPAIRKQDTQKPAVQTPTPVKQVVATDGYADLRQIKGLELPAELNDRPSEIVSHLGYTASHNDIWRVSNWVAYELTDEETRGSAKRTNKFVGDPKLGTRSAANSDYAKSGYDRGHMAPAADMSWSETAMKESFYFSNMCPQDPSLNRGIWKKLEDKSREWAQRDSAIIIVTGPVIKDTTRTIGKNKVLVPSMFYKVILSPYGKNPKAIGFLFRNEGSLKQLTSFAVSVDSIESLTGIDFFPALPDNIEDRIEAGYNLSDWF